MLALLGRVPAGFGLADGAGPSELERTLSWLPFGAGFRHGVIRAQPAVLLSMGTALLASAALGVTEVTDGGLRLVFIVLGLLLLGTFMLFFVLALTVVFFNWPKKLVPPYLREQPGIVSGRIVRETNR